MADELKDQRIPIMMSPSEVKAIDDWMFANRIKSRSEAIRRLSRLGVLFDPTNTLLDKTIALSKKLLVGEPDLKNLDEYVEVVETYAAILRGLMDINADEFTEAVLSEAIPVEVLAKMPIELRDRVRKRLEELVADK